METFLMSNGHELRATVDEQERIMLDLAAGTLSRDTFTEWVKQHTEPIEQ
jgi:death-on-curing protein